MQILLTEKKLREEIVGVSNVTWWAWRKAGKLAGLPVIQLGRRRFYSEEAVDTWLKGLATKTN